MLNALAGWLGLTILLIAGGMALAADVVRQAKNAAGAPARSGGVISTRWVRRLTIAAYVLTVAAAAATVVRLAALT